jgi:sporulation protein YlmC with PRC-barrel domain
LQFLPRPLPDFAKENEYSASLHGLTLAAVGLGMGVAHPQEATMHNRVLLSASTLTGEDVCDSQGHNLGTIEDFMLDPENGRIAYGVLSFGGILGIGNKLFAVPIEVMKLDRERRCFVLDIDEERLKEAPGFDKDHWPDRDTAGWSSRVYAFYGATPYWE